MTKAQDIFLFGGVEGGATATKICLIDSNGTVLFEDEAKGSNQWISGLSVVCQTIVTLFHKGKDAIGIPKGQPLKALGLALSGVGDPRLMEKELRRLDPTLALIIHPCDDTFGSIATVSPKGGVVLISGTGSACRLLNPDGTQHLVGGYGHLLGDEGSAWYISHNAIMLLVKTFDHLEDTGYCPEDLADLHHAALAYFKISTLRELIPIFYKKFEKSYIAGFGKCVAEAAMHGDKACVCLMEDAGFKLGLCIKAILPKVNSELFDPDHGLQIICAGSVWKSFPLLQEGFIRGVYNNIDNRGAFLPHFHLVTVARASSVGAASLGCVKAGLGHLPLDYAANQNSLFHYHAE
eukprot:GCRY01001613.1.p1 GENE.GCRY01001613.1~~GCRY01001613.1.p1  ORF type:complete len:350 (+),score=69.80 GCRY01001613.1:204-1253(+)